VCLSIAESLGQCRSHLFQESNISCAESMIGSAHQRQNSEHPFCGPQRNKADGTYSQIKGLSWKGERRLKQIIMAQDPGLAFNEDLPRERILQS